MPTLEDGRRERKTPLNEYECCSSCCTTTAPLSVFSKLNSTKTTPNRPTNQPRHQQIMPIFIDIDKKPHEESNTGLGDLVKGLYAAANDGDSPLTAQRKREEDELEEAAGGLC